MSDQPKKTRARIIAPKVELGPEFEIISDYWFTTFRELNPFDSSPFCPKCRRAALFERFLGILHGGAVSVNEFSCPNGHVWRSEKVND